MTTTNAKPTTVAILGAGPGLGLGAARHFGARGHQVALVARNRERLDGFVAELAADGIRATARAGDISDGAAFDRVVADITSEIGQIDLAIYQTSAPRPTAASPLDITADSERPYVEQALLAPIHAAHTLLQPMLARGSGALLFVLGASALAPMPMMSQLGIPLSGLRHHLLGLAEAAAAQGVRVGLLIVGGLILGSDIQREWVPDAGPDFPGALDPDELAAELSALLTGDSGPERIVGPYAP